MQNFFNPFQSNAFPGMNMNNNVEENYNPTENTDMNSKVCSCNNTNYDNNKDCGCHNNMKCPTTYKCCPPIVTCSKQVINQYHVTKQPYVHNYHTEIVHHYVTQNEFIPNYTCSEVHVNEPDNSEFPR